jgi:outer membrane immunogenic protein
MGRRRRYDLRSLSIFGICSSFAVVEQYRQNLNGWLGGGQIGVNHQIGRAVLGLELSGSWGDVSGSNSQTLHVFAFPPVPAACLNPHSSFSNLGTTINCHADQDWTTQVLAKFGYALPDGRLLPYVTGGVALTGLGIKTSEIISPGAPFQEKLDWGGDKMLLGGVVGGGMQYAVGGGVSLGVEYLYTLYGERNFTNVASCSGAPSVCLLQAGASPIPENHDLSTQTVRLVVNYEFGEH